MLEAGLTHSERLASIGRLAAGVAHEIGNPITGIACLAQTIRDEYNVGELQSLASQIIEQTDRTSKILQSLVSFAHAGSRSANNENRVFPVSEVFEEAQTLISLDRKNKDYRIELQCDPQASITGDAQHLLQVLVNLINNARDASPRSGSIRLIGALREGYVEVAVSDEGVGIPEAIRDRIFDPFFTTKEAGEGTGLGLSLVYSMVEEMDGEIDIISPLDRNNSSGTRVVLRFPAAAPQTQD
jgi:signal transduction histidine kinase